MTKRYQGPITRMYVTIVALILVVSLTGFVKNGKTVVIELDGAKQIVYTYAIKKMHYYENRIFYWDHMMKQNFLRRI